MTGGRWDMYDGGVKRNGGILRYIWADSRFGNGRRAYGQWTIRMGIMLDVVSAYSVSATEGCWGDEQRAGRT
jgi:hypothetical protein